MAHFVTHMFAVSVSLVIALVVTSSRDSEPATTGARAAAANTCMTPGCIGDQ